MIPGLDSATPPTAHQADAAKAAGYRLWSGYLATRPNVRLYHPWSRADFENARRCGGTPIAYASGQDDPVACRNLATQWNVRLCLDVETSIRPGGTWVDEWLLASHAGLYGTFDVQRQHQLHVPFRVMAGYPGRNPNVVWPHDQPRWAAEAHAWQWWGTHTEFGDGVDSGWYDDWFGIAAGPSPIIEEETEMLIVNTPTEGVWFLSGSLYVHVDDPPVLQSLLACGVKTWTIDEDMHRILVAGSTQRPEAAAPTAPPTPALAGELAITGTLKVGP